MTKASPAYLSRTTHVNGEEGSCTLYKSSPILHCTTCISGDLDVFNIIRGRTVGCIGTNITSQTALPSLSFLPYTASATLDTLTKVAHGSSSSASSSSLSSSSSPSSSSSSPSFSWSSSSSVSSSFSLSSSPSLSSCFKDTPFMASSTSSTLDFRVTKPPLI
ncbi:hypothetical protein PCH_Pc22g05720 [Penicillium rubens Wisconsin 54-1255]|uniref:Uncharacterized protein n=1 Tax=Penicillium rubens (strain ATCC 28089 / DSM 1075 / NRRL 1951 / Wisconsin 54-1255) TaxID=500485 RepID=B6HV61_PENRW|nr:hypothetical protein PCH_Pc22g05720 [Penicillium rubens Wisconsin 54-1255]